ncbi:MAG TPA: dihydrofolate reductase family protein [Dehalococcoidia bacterium]|jgi:dihydrofolate reductase|nr:dihydrofolate reductase family protein [Dehalococcoidia bacterium]
MSKLRFNISMSLDGYVAGPNQSVDNGLGEGGERLHDWVLPLKTFREIHGEHGGETGTNDDVLRQDVENIGATIMGRNMFGGGPGPWNESWKGWWGDNPPFHTSVFVLTHHAREPLVMQGGTTFFFVTDGIESALQQAKEAAGGKDVSLGGGANVAQQYLAAGLMNEMELHVVPLLLGSGERLLDNLGGSNVKLEPIRTVEGPGVTHLKYRVVKKDAAESDGQRTESPAEA